MKKAVIAIMGAASVFALTACQGVAVPAGQKSILVDDYAVIPTDPVVFDCQDPETSEYYWNVKEFIYPTRQISYVADDTVSEEDRERGAYVVVSNASAPAEMRIPVTVTFDLTDDCEQLKQFHRDFGTKYLPNDEDSIIVDKNDGWATLLNYVIGQPLEQTLISISQKYQWREIWNDEKVRGEFVAALQKRLPDEAKARTNGVQYFSNFRVTVGKPDPVDTGLKQAIVNEQNALANARTQETQATAEANARAKAAEAELAAAIAETKTAEQNALLRAAQIKGFPDVDSYLKWVAIEKGITPWPNPVVPGSNPR